jgi:Flp pilus assembly protein TadB
VSGPDVDVGAVRRGAARAGEPETDDRSLGDLVGELTRDLGQLMRQEVQLAKTELKEEASKAGHAAGRLTAAAVLGHLCALLAALAVAWAIGEAIPVWAGLAIVAAVLGVVAFVLYSRGRTEMQQIQPLPQQTFETLEEDARWAKAQPK